MVTERLSKLRFTLASTFCLQQLLLWIDLRSASFATLKTRKISSCELPKSPTGIRGLDEITYGDCQGRPRSLR